MELTKSHLKKLSVGCKRAVLILVGLIATFNVLFCGLVTSLILFIVGWLMRDRMLRDYGFNLMLSIDQFANVLLLGDPDQTISGRCGRAKRSGRAKWFVKPLGAFVDWLFLCIAGERDHILNAIEDDNVYTKELWSWINPE